MNARGLLGSFDAVYYISVRPSIDEVEEVVLNVGFV